MGIEDITIAIIGSRHYQEVHDLSWAAYHQELELGRITQGYYDALWNPQQWHGVLQEMTITSWGAFDGNRLIGIVSVSEDTLVYSLGLYGVFMFGNLAIHPDHQGKGVFRLLMGMVDKKADELSVDARYCTALSAGRSIDIYLKLGYQKTLPFMDNGMHAYVLCKKTGHRTLIAASDP